MRTTVEFDDDAARAVEQLRHATGMGVSQAVNHLVRRGLTAEPTPVPFVQQTRPLGIRIDVSNVAEALELLEGPHAR